MAASPSAPRDPNDSTKAHTGQSTLNSATVLRYPFHSIDLVWLMDYIGACFPVEERRLAAYQLLDGFIAFAVLHRDPLLTEACNEFHNAIVEKNEEEWPKEKKAMESSRNASRRVFEVIRLLSKYPQRDARSRMDSLGSVEKSMRDIEGEAKNIQTKLNTKPAEEATRSAISLIKRLRATPNDLNLVNALKDMLRGLFFCFSPCVAVYSMYRDNNTSEIETRVCSNHCPCYMRFRGMYTIFIKDIEKMKVVDCLLMMAVQDDAFACKLVEDLLQRLDYRNPFLDKPVRRIQNGSLFAARVALFDTFRYVRAIDADSTGSPADLPSHVVNVALALHVVRREVKNMPFASEELQALDRAILTADNVYANLRTGDVKQHLDSLKQYIITTFNLLSKPQYHLAVHGDMPSSETKVNPTCGNPCCPGNAKERLECTACRRGDCETNCPFCVEMSRRKVTPTAIKAAETEILTLKSAAFS